VAELSRRQIVELGIVAAQAGIETPEELMRYIQIGVTAEYRVPLAKRALADVQAALRGLVP
jgi:hypothetical protein